MKTKVTNKLLQHYSEDRVIAMIDLHYNKAVEIVNNSNVYTKNNINNIADNVVSLFMHS